MSDPAQDVSSTTTAPAASPTLDDLFCRTVVRRPDAIALVDPPNKQRISVLVTSAPLTWSGDQLFTQYKRHVRIGVLNIIIDVSEFMMGCPEPLGVILHTHQRAVIVLQVKMPCGCMVVLLACSPRRHRVEVRLIPEVLSKSGKPQADIICFRLFYHPLGRLILE